MPGILSERYQRAHDSLAAQRETTALYNHSLVTARFEDLAAWSESLQFPEGTSRRITIPAFERAILKFARTGSYPEREIGTEDITLKTLTDEPQIPGAAINATLTCRGYAKYGEGMHPSGTYRHPIEGGPIDSWLLSVCLCSSDSSVASRGDVDTTPTPWYNRPGPYVVSQLYSGSVGDSLPVDQRGESLVVPDGPDRPEVEEYGRVLEEVWAAVCDPNRNPHLFSPVYLANVA